MPKKWSGYIRNMPIGVMVNIASAIAFVIFGLVTIPLVNRMMRHQALYEAEKKSLILLDHNLATHHYFSTQLKPNVFELIEGLQSADYFDPVWMSSTYAVRGIENNFKGLSEIGYYYKESAINARYPDNEADEFERAFIQELNENPELQNRSEIRNIDGEPYFVTLRRGEMMDESCLRCHSEPEVAPGEMVAFYGGERSFHRQAGEAVSAISIRIPLAQAYYEADRLSFYLILLLLAALGVLFFAQSQFVNRLMMQPLEFVRAKAIQITSDQDRLGETIPLPAGRELEELTQAFNTMSLELRSERDGLEMRIQERTARLDLLNQKLQADIAARRQVEQELQHSLADRELLVKDTFHRVKNNLMVIDSLLYFQSKSIHDLDTLELFRESQSRIKAMLLIHKRLHESNDLTHIDFAAYIEDLSHALFDAYKVDAGRIHLVVDVKKEITLSADAVTSCGMILNELISNALKYAFQPGEEGELRISLRRLGENDEIELVVQDNGIGLEPQMDIQNCNSLGLKIVQWKVQDLHGKLTILSENGTTFRIEFPKNY